MVKQALGAALVSALMTVIPCSSAFATCPSTLAERVVYSIKGDGCVLRRAADSSGTYNVACASEDINAGYASLFDASHALTGFSWIAYGAGLSYFNALDAVGLSSAGSYAWATTWHAYNAATASIYAFFQLFTSSLSVLTSPNFISDPSAYHETVRWGQAVGALSTSGRFANVTSLEFPWMGANACCPSSHVEWRVVINIKNSDGSTFGSQNLFASQACSYSSSHSGSAGWGQEMPAIAPYYYNGGKFVVTWHDRTTGKVMARVFTDAGVAVTGDIEVATVQTTLNAAVVSPRVFAFDNGFVIVWTRGDGYGNTWMRTFRPDGTPFTSQMAVEASGAVASAPDVHGLTFRCPGSFYTTPYFAVSWLRNVYDSQNDRRSWYPEYRVFSGLSSVAPLTSDLPVSSTPTIAPISTPPIDDVPALWERVSLNFFQGCSTYLMLGMAWPVADLVNGTYHDLRDKFVQLDPGCSSTMAIGYAATSDGAEQVYCDGDTCVQLDDIPVDPQDRTYIQPTDTEE